jgi:hypothetical protein
VRYAKGSRQRVRAFMRVTRSANGSTRCGSVEVAGSAWRTLHGGRRQPAELSSETGGPGPLTEDRQKPGCRQCRGLRVGPLATRVEGMERVTPCLPGRRDRVENLDAVASCRI